LIVHAIRALSVPHPGVEAIRALDAAIGLDSPTGPQSDPEAILIYAFLSTHLQNPGRTLELLERSVRGGFAPVYLLETSPRLDFIRTEPRFVTALDIARRRREVAAAIFERNGGGTLLGLAPGTA
jgi:hypothetical protein